MKKNSETLLRFILHPSSFRLLVVARHRLDGRDDLVVGDLLGRARKGGVASIHEDGAVVLGVAAQRADELTPFCVVEWPKVHRRTPFLVVKVTKTGLTLSRQFR